jgi:hypothetical protein
MKNLFQVWKNRENILGSSPKALVVISGFKGPRGQRFK